MCMRHDVTPMNIMNENENGRYEDGTRKLDHFIMILNPNLSASETVNHGIQNNHRLYKRNFNDDDENDDTKLFVIVNYTFYDDDELGIVFLMKYYTIVVNLHQIMVCAEKCVQ